MNKVLLQIDACRNNGSTGRINEQIGLMAESNGWASYIAHGARYVNPSKLKSIQVVSKIEEYWHAIETKLFDNHGLSSRFATWRFIRKIKKIKPTVIHLHTIHGYYINYKILFKYIEKEGIPVVWTLHDCWNFTGHCGHFISEGCNRWKSGCYDCPLKGAYPASYLFDRSKQNYFDKRKFFTSIPSMILVPVSDWLGSLAKESFLKETPIYRIYNGVDINVFKPNDNNTQITRKKYGLDNNDFVMIACATTWGESKGIYDYIELSKHLKENERLLLVGIDDEWKKKLPANILSISRTESIQELVELYSSADVVLNLSYQETFGLTTVEGLACGTPGIVYNSTASPELITDNTGIIVDPGNISDVILAIQTIKRNGKGFYTEFCRSRALDFFNSKNNYMKYMDLYETLSLGLQDR